MYRVKYLSFRFTRMPQSSHAEQISEIIHVWFLPVRVKCISMVLKTFLSCFSGYALELLNRSLISLQETFTSTWGLVYFENSQVFADLYQDLSDYYKGSTTNVNLEEVLNEFWIKLMEKLFYTANKPNSIGKIVQYQNMTQVNLWLNVSLLKCDFMW